MTEIAKILKIIRTEHDISMQGMADMLGVSRPYLSMIGTGKNPMPEDWIYKL
ncbi:MAG: helix-turn-helix domain-containing protein [Roseburia sp.]|nr:helix-turn-helix domain-containing protein [Roseburia sp.]MCM1279005.1 helix-turn-helix domain-containing protein [Robinsoniella sp.]